MLYEFYQSTNPALSFELFPPKSVAGEQLLYQHVDRLMAYQPSFITCTYGAGGSTQSKTLEIVGEVKRRYAIPVASHLTLVGSTADDLRAYLQQAVDQSVDFIVALRGDPPAGSTHFQTTPGGFRYANELVGLIKTEFPQLGILVAGYPEKHQEAVSIDSDLEALRRKLDAGGEVVLTQLFYDNEDFFRFRDRCEQIGISQPIVPGLLPVTNLDQIKRITSLCGAKLPDEFVNRLGQHNDPDWQFQVGVDQSVQQVEGLLAGGVPGFHFYVLNRSDATIKIMENTNFNSSIVG